MGTLGAVDRDTRSRMKMRPSGAGWGPETLGKLRWGIRSKSGTRDREQDGYRHMGGQDKNGNVGSRSRMGTLGQVWGWGHLEQNGNEGIRNRVGTGIWSTGQGEDKGHQEQGGGLGQGHCQGRTG